MLDSGGNKPEKGLQIINALHFFGALESWRVNNTILK